MKRWPRAVGARSWLWITAAVAALGAVGCGTDVAPGGFGGAVTDPAREPVAGATVYAIPAGLVTRPRVTAADVVAATADDFDEPLQGLIDAMGATFPRAVTDGAGEYRLSPPADGDASSYYLYVVPDPGDPLHLPGGSESRRSLTVDELARRGRVDIRISSQPSSFGPAGYIGSGACIACHPGEQAWRRHAHANGIHEPGIAAPLQDAARIAAVDAPTLAKLAADTTLYYYDFDPTRGDDKFKIQEGGAPPSTAEFAYRMFQSGDHYEAQFLNLIDPAGDPVHGQTFKIDFLYGGLIFKQRFISRLSTSASPPTTSDAYFIFPPAQLQPGGTLELPLAADRRRWPWVDVRAANFWDRTTSRFKVPVLTESFDAQCSSCHFTGFSIDPVTLESTAFESSGGIPWRAPGRRVEGNLGCEVCHGPGLEHQQAADTRPGQFIVEPGYLAAERMMAICGQCHSRPVGNDSLGMHDQPPLSLANRMMPPGGSRRTWRAQYVVRPDGNPKTDFWEGGLHSKLNRQQYSDLRKSTKYANPRMLVTCTDCHDVHGERTDPERNPRGLTASIDDNSLCRRCHAPEDLEAGPGAAYHSLHALIGQLRPEVGFRCVTCHMDPTGRSGAGRPGGADGVVQYIENDISDHTFVVPRKDDPGVASHTLLEAAQGKAMPIPYTRSCSNCHVLGTVAAKP